MPTPNDKKDNEPDTIATPSNMGCYVFFVIIIALIILGFFLVNSIHDSLSDRAQFGDSWGWVNAIFTGLAMFFVAWSIMIQRQELREIRESNEETRKSLKEQNEAIQTQLKIAKKTAELERDRLSELSEPVFAIKIQATVDKDNITFVYLNIHNGGKSVKDVNLELEICGRSNSDRETYKIFNKRVIANQQFNETIEDVAFHPGNVQRINCKIAYRNHLGQIRYQQFYAGQLSEDSEDQYSGSQFFKTNLNFEEDGLEQEIPF